LRERERERERETERDRETEKEKGEGAERARQRLTEKYAATSSLHVGFIPLESTFNNEPHPAHAVVL